MARLVTIAVLHDLPAAVCLRSALESLGIPVFVDGLHHASVDWLITFALAGLRVRVTDDDAETARDYLRQVAPDLSARPSVSSDIWSRPVLNGLLVVVSLCVVPIWKRSRT